MSGAQTPLETGASLPITTDGEQPQTTGAAHLSLEAQLRRELLHREECDDFWAHVADQCRLSAEVSVVIDQCMLEIAERKEDPREALRQLLV